MRHSVYVIELRKDVLLRRKFVEANPHHSPAMPCVYVGMTGLSVEERFANHRSGHKACRYVEQYGMRLLPELYGHFNPMAFEDAQRMEAKLAAELRKQGYAVWQA